MRRILLCLGLFLLVGIAAAGENLVENPGFEQPASNGKAPAAWGVPGMPGAKFSWDDEVSRSGNRSGRVEGIDPEKQGRYVQAWRQDVGPLPDAELLLSLWVKGKNLGQGKITILHRDAEHTVLVNQGIATVEGTFEWKEIVAPLRLVPGAVELQLVLGLQESVGTVWFDDVVVTPVDGVDAIHGTVMMAPAEPQVAGSTVPVRFEVALGTRGLVEGGSIQLRWEDWRAGREFRFGNVHVTCDQQDAAFAVATPPRKKTWPPTQRPVTRIITLEKAGPLQADSKIIIETTLTYTPNSNVACPLQVLMAAGPSNAIWPLSKPFVVSAKGGPAAELRCIAEARPLAGEPGRITVAATDAYGNPSVDYCGTVALACNTNSGLPREFTFTEDDGGSHVFEGRFPHGTVSRVQVTSGGLTATSNPILPREAGEPGIYFGDLHSHCEISSDGVGDPDQAYDHARRFWGLDLAALSDHSPRGERWKRAVDAANRHNAGGRFVTFVAFEWSDSRRGHRNAYFRDDTGLQQPDLRDNMRSWWDFFDERDVRVLTVPHHPNTQSAAKRPDGKSVWGPVDWSVVNDTYQRIVELNQIRGSFEVPGGPIPELRVVREDVGSSVQTALATGHRLGFIGSTDTHSGRPGTGVARCAIVSGSFSRAGLWDSLHARSCYATSGEHILVLFALNDRPMGSEIRLDDTKTRRQVAWRAVGTGPIERVDLLRNNEIVKSWEGEGKDDLSDTFSQAEPVAETEWWYIRVIQADTHMAWSSPIWIDPSM